MKEREHLDLLISDLINRYVRRVADDQLTYTATLPPTERKMRKPREPFLNARFHARRCGRVALSQIDKLTLELSFGTFPPNDNHSAADARNRAKTSSWLITGSSTSANAASTSAHCSSVSKLSPRSS